MFQEKKGGAKKKLSSYSSTHSPKTNSNGKHKNKKNKKKDKDTIPVNLRRLGL